MSGVRKRIHFSGGSHGNPRSARPQPCHHHGPFRGSGGSSVALEGLARAVSKQDLAIRMKPQPEPSTWPEVDLPRRALHQHRRDWHWWLDEGSKKASLSPLGQGHRAGYGDRIWRRSWSWPTASSAVGRPKVWRTKRRGHPAPVRRGGHQDGVNRQRSTLAPPAGNPLFERVPCLGEEPGAQPDPPLPLRREHLGVSPIARLDACDHCQGPRDLIAWRRTAW
jgi:hypothetical protein